MKDKDNTFFKLGKTLGITSTTNSITDKELSSVETYLDNIEFDTNHIENCKKFASILESVISTFNSDKSPVCFHLKKIASEDSNNWNSHCEEVIDTCVNALEKNNVDKFTFSKMAAVAETVARLGTMPIRAGAGIAGMGIPLMGALGGGLSWIAEKELSEDDLDTEILKAKIREYQRLSAEIDKEVKRRYQYKLEEELRNELKNS